MLGQRQELVMVVSVENQRQNEFVEPWLVGAAQLSRVNYLV